jgi:hypothetical protein
MLYRVAFAGVVSLGSALAFASEEVVPAVKSLEERLQIVGTIAQKEQSGTTEGVVIFKLDDQRTVFGTLGKSFEIDQQWYYVVRIDGRHATIANVNRSADDREFEILYINPPSSNTLIYEAQPDSLNAAQKDESVIEDHEVASESSESRSALVSTAPVASPSAAAPHSNVEVTASADLDVASEEAQPVLVDDSEPTEVIDGDADEIDPSAEQEQVGQDEISQ